VSIYASDRERVGVVTFLLDTRGSTGLSELFPVTIGIVVLVQPSARGDLDELHAEYLSEFFLSSKTPLNSREAFAPRTIE
jgi:hypothetical protein